MSEYYATVQNQYGRLIGDGYADNETDALQKARKAARETIAWANPNWSWRIGKVRVEEVYGRTKQAH